MRNVTVKYLTKDRKTGHLTYRRRVPDSLKGITGKREFLKVLGRTEAEALTFYGPFHQRIEHMIALAERGVTTLSEAERQKALAAMLQEWGADPHGPGKDDQERTWREEAAESIVAPYQDDDTGDYRGVPADADAMATALLAGVPKTKPKPTVTDAFKFYLTEKAKRLPEQRVKQEQRFRRAEKALIAVMGGDKAVCDVTREDARNWRDAREAQGASAATIKRERNDISAVIGLANSELDAGDANPFRKLALKAATVTSQEERDPLPQGVIDGVYADLAKANLRLAKEQLRIWTLLDFTGARPTEVRTLRLEEFHLSDPVPHITIPERDDRTLKTLWSVREVPLVGTALTVAKSIVAERKSGYAFPSYADEKGMDRLSAALNRRIRAHSKNPKHVTYSLRHNMADRLIAADVLEATREAIAGRAQGTGQGKSYGSGVTLEKKREALLKAFAGYRE